MATIIIDGKPFETRPDTNLLQACLSSGADLPYFCWHPDLGSVGACRQCAVKQYSGPEDTKGRIVMACMTPATDGTRLSIADPEAVDFRSSVVEWLMTNHPHDCPVCEEGGECHLQDMTVMTGHHSRRYRFTKRTHRNQDLGPFVKHEMNRCIACYRCVRFYRDYAGGDDLAAFASRNSVYFGRQQDGRLESDFSGNLVEVCPTGVFTDKPFSAVYTRKWDMRGAPSICPHCAVGCNIIVNERAGKVRRVLNRFNGAVNRYFLCDRGRFGFDFVNAPGRIRTALRRDGNGPLHPVEPEDALLRFGTALREGRAIGIGSPRASLEANFALQTLVGAHNFHAGVSEAERTLLLECARIIKHAPVRIATLHEAEGADAVLVLGEDVSKTAPRLGLALRQSVRQRSFDEADALKVPLWLDAAVRTIGAEQLSPLFVVTPAATDLDPIAAAAIRATPEDIERLALSISRALDAGPDAAIGQSGIIARALVAAHRPLVVCGTQCLTVAGLRAVSELAAILHRKRPDTRLVLVMPECNSLGLALLGGEPLEAALHAAGSGDVHTVVVLENDLSRRVGPEILAAAFGALPNLIVLDHLDNPTTDMADLVLPVAAFTEADGTLVSSEARAQRFFQVTVPPMPIQESWRWIRDGGRAAGRNQHFNGQHFNGQHFNGQHFNWQKLDDVIAALAAAHPDLAAIQGAAPDADFRVAGSQIRTEPHRFSGRTAMSANVSVRDRKPETNPDAPMSMTMEGYYGQMPGSLVPYLWAPGWNSGHSLNKFQEEVGGAMRGGDQGVRLFENSAPAAAASPFASSQRVDAHPDEILVVPRMTLFGSEELSRHAPAAAGQIAPATLRLSTQDRANHPSDRATLTLAGITRQVNITVDDDLPAGVASFPAHMEPFSHFASPGWARLSAQGEGS